MKRKFIVSVPFTGLGLYGGFRGNRWLRNRIKIFEQFVIPSLKAQTDQDFLLWVQWRQEEFTNPQVKELYTRLKSQFKTVFTYGGVPFWDDKYSDDDARERLIECLHRSVPELLDHIADCDEVVWLLQPSDDCYSSSTIQDMNTLFNQSDAQVASYKRGFIANYFTKEVLEYNPKTNPPFFAIRFPKDIFIDPGKHVAYTGPYKSHEYIGDKLKLKYLENRGFLVGTHTENISTHFKHPYGGARMEGVLDIFGLENTQPLSLPFSVRKWFMRQLPHGWRRKIRYWFGEIIGTKIYNFLRN